MNVHEGPKLEHKADSGNNCFIGVGETTLKLEIKPFARLLKINASNTS